MSDVISVIQNLTEQITAIAWALFVLTWSIGWTLRGSPIPFSRLKRTGTSLVEDSIWAAFWLAVGSSLFAFIAYLVQQIVSS